MSRTTAGSLRLPAKLRNAELWLVLILIASFTLTLIHLAHPQLTYWDEAFHAILARNLLKHPFTPVLYDPDWLGLPSTNWESSTIWLHKPPFAFWQIALSFSVFGVNTFALRLPSAILHTAAAYMTYRIGAQLFDSKWPGLIASALQAFNPFLMGSVHGYYFADHIDIALMFWIEAAIAALILVMRSQRRRYDVLAGLCMGLGFLTKALPALIVALIAILMAAASWFTSRVLRKAPKGWSVRPQDLVIFSTSACAIVLPWVISTAIRFPTEFSSSAGMWLGHLTQDVEGWAAPWDRHLFDYMIHQLSWIYTPTLLALLFITVRAVRGRLGEIMVALWAWGVIVPFSLAVSKTWSMTLIALPALLLALGRLLEQSYRGTDEGARALLGAGGLAAALVSRGTSVVTQVGAKGLPPLHSAQFAPYLCANAWIATYFSLTALFFLLFTCIHRSIRPISRRAFETALLIVGFSTMTIMALRYATRTVEFALKPPTGRSFKELGTAIQQQLPPDAVLIVGKNSTGSSHPDDGSHLSLMFWSDRSTYHAGAQLHDEPLPSIAARIRSAGGVPFLVTDARPDDTQPALVATADGFRVFAISEKMLGQHSGKD